MTATPEPEYDRHRPIRVEKTLWDAFGELAGLRGRSEVVRQFIRWYVRQPGARLPERPPAERKAPRQRSAV